MRLRPFVFQASLALLLWSCAATQLLRQGNQLLAEGKHNEAIAKFEEVLKVDPSNGQAQERIREARRAAVRAQLDVAEAALSAGEFASALKEGLKARRMPLDLEDVDLVRRIDDTVAKAAKLAEERVHSFAEQGHFVPAVELSQQVRDASPGVASRDRWAADVRKRAVEHYLQLAASAETVLPGSSAVQLAMARSVGAEVEAAKVAELWNRFALPTCFGEPEVTVEDRSGKAAELGPKVEAAARAELNELRARCGEGTQPLGVKINIATLDVVDKTEKERGAKPLPGVDIKTEEIYYEEEPYTVMEEVIEEETRKEMQEKRDCAPRPGRERGCRTWTEEVEIKVPVKKVKEVQKIRRIERRRPLRADLPADKVVTYEITRVTRRVTVSGSVEVLGGVGKPRVFSLVAESVDTGHPEASHPKMTVPADALEVKEMAQVVADASAAVSGEVGMAVADAVDGWSRRFEEEAGKKLLAGRIPEAEELYLKLLALGVTDTKDVTQFFEKRYGRKVDAVLDMLATALGRQVEVAKAGEPAAKRAGGFPKLTPKARQTGGAETPLVEAAIQATSSPVVPAVPMVPARAEPQKPSMSEEELRALEEESLATSTPAGAPETQTDAAPGAPAPAAAPEEKPAESGSEEPKRGPVKPKT